MSYIYTLKTKDHEDVYFCGGAGNGFQFRLRLLPSSELDCGMSSACKFVGGQSYDTTVTGLPKIIENDGGAITITYLEYYTKGNCSNKNDVVTRIFTIRNAKGDLQRCNQSIFLKHRTINEIRFPTDTTVSYPKTVLS